MRKWVSEPQLYTARRGRPSGAGAGYVQSIWVLPHDLGVVPETIRLHFKCLIPDLGYAAGDTVSMAPHSDDRLTTAVWGFFVSSAATGYTIVKTPTEVKISFDLNHGASMRVWNSKKNARPANKAWEFTITALAT